MKIAELKSLIKDLPDDMPVLIDGYESDFDDAKVAEVRMMAMNVGSCQYSGKHQHASGSDGVPAFVVTTGRSDA